MKENYLVVLLPDGSKREITWPEINLLKKDILWIYDENYRDIANGFVPTESFNLKYWEYLSLEGNGMIYDDQKAFYQTGVLIILLCCCSEYIDIPGGDQEVFSRQELPIISNYVENYQPKDKGESLLKEKILLGLNIAQSIPEQDLKNNDYVHPDSEKYYKNLNETGYRIIADYYKSKLEK